MTGIRYKNIAWYNDPAYQKLAEEIRIRREKIQVLLKNGAGFNNPDVLKLYRQIDYRMAKINKIVTHHISLRRHGNR